MGSPEEVTTQFGIKEGFLEAVGWGEGGAVEKGDSRANVIESSGTSPGKEEGKIVGGRGTGYAKAFNPGRAWHMQSVWKKMAFASVLSQRSPQHPPLLSSYSCLHSVNASKCLLCAWPWAVVQGRQW